MKLSMSAVAALVCLSWSAVHAQQIYEVGNGVTAPRVVKSTMPARALGTDLVVQCVVTSDGTVRDAAVVRPGNAADDSAAVEAVTRWQFAPGTREGEPVAVRFYVQFHKRTQR